MLLKHSFQYLFARGVPGIISFAAIALFTRLLSPEEYGRYALVIAISGFAYTVLFYWLPLSLLRFAPAQKDNSKALISTIVTTYIGLVLLSAVIGTVILAFITNPLWRQLTLVGFFVLWARAWFELNKEMARSSLSPMRYGLMEFIKSSLSLVLGGTLAYFGLGANGVLIGFGIGLLVSTLWNAPVLRYALDFRHAALQFHTLVPLLKYGLPLSVGFTFEFIVSGSDRLLLGWLLDVDQAGLYAAGYDLPRQVLILMMGIIHLAAYPLVIRVFEADGVEATREQLSKTLTLLLSVALPAVAGIIVLAPNVAHIFLGREFQSAAVLLIPWVAGATLLDGLRIFYVDLSFQLTKRTAQQITVISSAAVTNLLLNFWLIPKFGIYGAAYATFAAYALALSLAATLSQKHMRLKFPTRTALSLLGAALFMAVTIYPFSSHEGVAALIGQVLLGVGAYLTALVIFNIAGSRGYAVTAVASLRSVKKAKC